MGSGTLLMCLCTSHIVTELGLTIPVNLIKWYGPSLYCNVTFIFCFGVSVVGNCHFSRKKSKTKTSKTTTTATSRLSCSLSLSLSICLTIVQDELRYLFLLLLFFLLLSLSFVCDLFLVSCSFTCYTLLVSVPVILYIYLSCHCMNSWRLKKKKKEKKTRKKERKKDSAVAFSCQEGWGVMHKFHQLSQTLMSWWLPVSYLALFHWQHEQIILMPNFN